MLKRVKDLEASNTLYNIYVLFRLLLKMHHNITRNPLSNCVRNDFMTFFRININIFIRSTVIPNMYNPHEIVMIITFQNGYFPVCSSAIARI